MWAIRDFAGRYFSDGGWTEYSREALLYVTCEEAERSMQENGIVDAYCIVAGGDGNRRETCLNCLHYDSKGSKCLILPSYDNYMYHTCSCDNFKEKQEGPSQPVDDTLDTRYRHGSIECIDAIRAALTPEEFRGFCKGNIMKYVWRERHKGGDADLDKARDYVGYAVAGDIYGEL